MQEKNSVKFYKGKAYIHNIGCLIAPLNSIVTFLYFLKKENNTEYIEFLESIKEFSFEFESRNQKYKYTKEMIEPCLYFLNSIGFGPISFIRKSKNEVFIFQNNLKTTFKHHKTSDLEDVISEVTAKFLEGFIKSIAQKETFSEIKKTKKEIYFKINITEKINIKKNQIKTKSKDLKQIKFNKILKRVISHQHLKTENGKMSIWGVQLLAIPTKIFDNFNLKEHKEVFKLFENIGKVQGGAAYSIIANKFGKNKNKFEIFEGVYLQTELIGAGKTKIIRFDEENKEIELNFVDDVVFQSNKISLIGIYLLAIFKGTLTKIFNKEVKCFIKEKTILFKVTSQEPKKDSIEETLNTYLGILAITS